MKYDGGALPYCIWENNLWTKVVYTKAYISRSYDLDSKENGRARILINVYISH